MSTWPFVKLERSSLKNHPVLVDSWIQDRIAEDPSILGLGALSVSQRQSYGNGLEQLLVTRPGSSAQYALLVQTGAVDEVQLVRALESGTGLGTGNSLPAVLVAEAIGSRYLNLLGALGSAVPLAAIEMQAMQFGEQMTVLFNTVGGGPLLVEPLAVAETLPASSTQLEATAQTETCEASASPCETTGDSGILQPATSETAGTPLNPGDLSSETTSETSSEESPSTETLSTEPSNPEALAQLEQSVSADSTSTDSAPTETASSEANDANEGNSGDGLSTETTPVEASSDSNSAPTEAPSTDTAITPSPLEAVDRSFWEECSPASVEMADRLLAITQAIDPFIELVYRSSYMALSRQGQTADFARFTPEPSGLLLGLDLEQNSLIELSIAQAGLERLQGEDETSGYNIRLAAADIEAQRAPVARLIQLAYEESRA